MCVGKAGRVVGGEELWNEENQESGRMYRSGPVRIISICGNFSETTRHEVSAAGSPVLHLVC